MFFLSPYLKLLDDGGEEEEDLCAAKGLSRAPTKNKKTTIKCNCRSKCQLFSKPPFSHAEKEKVLVPPVLPLPVEEPRSVEIVRAWELSLVVVDGESKRNHLI